MTIGQYIDGIYERASDYGYAVERVEADWSGIRITVASVARPDLHCTRALTWALLGPAKFDVAEEAARWFRDKLRHRVPR